MESQPLNSERPKNPFYCVFHSLVAFLSNLNPCQLSSLRLSFNLDNECSQEAICPIFTSLTLFRHINTISSPPLLYNHCPEKKNPPLRHPPPTSSLLFLFTTPPSASMFRLFFCFGLLLHSVGASMLVQTTAPALTWSVHGVFWRTS